MGGNGGTTTDNADNGKTGTSADLTFSRYVFTDARFLHAPYT
jgi:hypothetical protein